LIFVISRGHLRTPHGQGYGVYKQTGLPHVVNEADPFYNIVSVDGLLHHAAAHAAHAACAHRHLRLFFLGLADYALCGEEHSRN